MLTYTQCVYKKQNQLLVAQHHQTAPKRSNFWQRFKRQLRVWLCFPPHLHNAQNVSDKLHFGYEQTSQTVKPQIQKLSALTP